MREHIYIQNQDRTPSARDREWAKVTRIALRKVLEELAKE